jgi:hypothetical protein
MNTSANISGSIAVIMLNADEKHEGIDGTKKAAHRFSRFEIRSKGSRPR